MPPVLLRLPRQGWAVRRHELRADRPRLPRLLRQLQHQVREVHQHARGPRLLWLPLLPLRLREALRRRRAMRRRLRQPRLRLRPGLVRFPAVCLQQRESLWSSVGCCCCYSCCSLLSPSPPLSHPIPSCRALYSVQYRPGMRMPVRLRPRRLWLRRLLPPALRLSLRLQACLRLLKAVWLHLHSLRTVRVRDSYR